MTCLKCNSILKDIIHNSKQTGLFCYLEQKQNFQLATWELSDPRIHNIYAITLIQYSRVIHYIVIIRQNKQCL